MTDRAAGGSAARGNAAEDEQKGHLPGDPDLKPARHDITVDELRAAFPQWHIVQRLSIWWAIRGGLQHWSCAGNWTWQPRRGCERTAGHVPGARGAPWRPLSQDHDQNGGCVPRALAKQLK